MLKVVKKKDKLKLDWTARQLYEYHQLVKATYAKAVQRGLVWKVDKKSLLIHTIMEDGLVPPSYVAKMDGSEAYDFIDGKQRSYALFEFLNDEFPLTDIPKVEVLEEDGHVEMVDVNGKTFSELPDYMQNAVKDFSFEIQVMLNPTDDEIADTFFRLNNGVSLSAMTLARVKAADRKKISEIGGHELFKKSLTQKALEKYDNEMLVVKSYMMLHEGPVGLEMKEVRPYMNQMKITQEDQETIGKVFDRLLSVHNQIEDKRTAKRVIAKTHMVSLVPFIERSIEEKRSEDDVVQWLSDFYNGGRSATKSESYNSTVRCGTSRKESVCKRHQALEKSYDECMEAIDSRRNFQNEVRMAV